MDVWVLEYGRLSI